MATAAAAAAEDIKFAPLKFYFLRRGGSGGVWVFFFFSFYFHLGTFTRFDIRAAFLLHTVYCHGPVVLMLMVR